MLLLTIDSKFHGPAFATIGDGINGHALVDSLVLFLNRTDE